MSRWFRGELRDFLTRELAPDRIARQGVFNPREVSKLVEQHLSARGDHENKLWALVTFGLWYDMYLDPTTGQARDCEAPGVPA